MLRTPLHRLVTLICVCAVALASLVTLSAWPHAAAQDAAFGAMADHPIVGAWWWDNNSADPFDDSFAIFHADGTYVEETSYIGAGIGAWEVTGERTGELIIVFQDIEGGLDPNLPAAFVAGTATFRLSFEVDETGNELSASGPVEIRTPDGAMVDTITFDGTGTRLVVGWERPAATPTA